MTPSGSASKQVRTSAADKVSQLRQQQRRSEQRRAVLIWGSLATAILLIAGIVTFSIVREQQNKPSLDAVSTYTVTQGHTPEAVTYEQSPPAGGEHAAVWLNCGSYEQPVPNENAVHSMEHGAVWVTYQPDLPTSQVDQLRENLPDTYAVLSPFKGLQSPVVVSAWGKQLALDGATDQRLDAFVRAYRQGPDTPEPGASCTGGSDGSTLPGGGS